MIFKIKNIILKFLFGRKLTKVRMKRIIRDLQILSQEYTKSSLDEFGEDVKGSDPLVQYYKGKANGIKETLTILEPFYNNTIN